jgi:L-asparagine transporter-like permease
MADKVEKKAKTKAGKKADEKAGEAGIKQKSIKSWMPWLPFVSWILGAAIVTCLLFIFYKPSPSPTITAAYFVIVLLGFYILWRSRRKGYWKGKGKGAV